MERRNADELRAKFFANHEKVQSWLTRWNCPELEWSEVPVTPSSWSVPPDILPQWLETRAPFLDDYDWFLEARPLARGITSAWAEWRFGAEHEFVSLRIELQTVADPQYVAETLALAADAAALKGWRDGDIQPLYAWLLEGLDRRPFGNWVNGQNRTGFILFDLTRVGASDTEIQTHLRITLTNTALDGTPLNEDGIAPTA